MRWQNNSAIRHRKCTRRAKYLFVAQQASAYSFSLNRDTSFESIVRHPVYCAIDREHKHAVVQLPELIPGVNLLFNRQYPVFRFVINLGCVADRHFSIYGYQGDQLENRCVYTDWHHATAVSGKRSFGRANKHCGPSGGYHADLIGGDTNGDAGYRHGNQACEICGCGKDYGVG